MYSSFFNIRYFILIVILLFLIIFMAVPLLCYNNLNISFDNNFNGNYLISSEFSWPVPGFTRITSLYGNRPKPTQGASSFHYGIDIAATTGSNLVSAINGKVVYADFNRCKWLYYKNRK